MNSSWVHRVLGLVIGTVAFLLSAYGVVPSAETVWADEPGMAALEEEIDDLKDRLARLESKLAAQQAAPAAAGGAGISLPSGLQGIELSGFVDTAYTYNFNEPEDTINDGRIFDVQANSFVVHNAQLNVSKGVDEYSPVGFNLTLMFGDDSEITSSTGFATDKVDIQQAYVEYLADIGDGLDLTFGKQATLIGAEVIESKDNWNYSRSYMFGLAIPFTHTGIRASYPLSETLSFTTGINNGWSVVDDDNIGKGIEGQIAWEDGPAFVSMTGMYSPEITSTTAVTLNDNADRWIYDLVATYQVNDDLALMLNYDYGHEADVLTLGNDTSWQGIALYAKQQLSETCSLAGRYEFYRDADGTKSPTISGTAGDLSLQELTLTAESQINQHLIARLEYRHDWANSNVFGHDDSGFQNYQDTVAVEFIMPF